MQEKIDNLDPLRLTPQTIANIKEAYSLLTNVINQISNTTDSKNAVESEEEEEEDCVCPLCEALTNGTINDLLKRDVVLILDDDTETMNVFEENILNEGYFIDKFGFDSDIFKVKMGTKALNKYLKNNGLCDCTVFGFNYCGDDDFYTTKFHITDAVVLNNFAEAEESTSVINKDVIHYILKMYDIERTNP